MSEQPQTAQKTSLHNKLKRRKLKNIKQAQLWLKNSLNWFPLKSEYSEIKGYSRVACHSATKQIPCLTGMSIPMGNFSCFSELEGHHIEVFNLAPGVAAVNKCSPLLGPSSSMIFRTFLISSFLPTCTPSSRIQLFCLRLGISCSDFVIVKECDDYSLLQCL